MEQKLVSKVLHIDGMTCTSCEMRIENVLKKLEGIEDVKVSYSDSSVRVTYDVIALGLDKIMESIEKLHYKVESVDGRKIGGQKENDSSTQDSADKKMGINQLVFIGIVVLALYLIINNTVGFNFIPEVNQSMGYGILFVVGLLTSLHCIAMCGGINLSVCVKYAGGNNDSRFGKLMPSALYNIGRVISYTLIGGIVGALGSVVSFSGTAKGVVAILSGVFMVIMGLNMLNIFPWLRKLNPRMPKIFGNKVHSNSGSKGPLFVGLLNGLMPCGPLQAMQLYALGTGSFTAGAISMFLFSVGTVPLMFGFGAASSFLSGKFTHKMMKISAVLVMILGVIMFDRGMALSGYSLSFALPGTGAAGNVAVIEGDVQLVTTKLESGSYTPIIVQKGIPVKWTIKAEKEDLNGCNNPVTIPKYNKQVKLVPGDNLIEFTPEEEGDIVYTCWMGMISSKIRVVSDINKISDEDVSIVNESSGQGSGGGCCAGGSGSTGSGDSIIPVDEVAIGEIRDGIQYVSFNVNDYGFSPALIVMQKGTQTNFVINGEQLNYCNNSLIFPEYNARVRLKDGENLIEFVPEADFTFLCWMGMLNGYVKVVDDIESIDINAIKEEVKNYIPPQGSTGGGCH